MLTETRLTNINNESLVPFTSSKDSDSQKNFHFHSSFLYNDINLRDLLNQTIEDLCNLYDEEEMKGNYAASVLNLMDQFLATRNLKPEDLINCTHVNQLIAFDWY
ncbi:22478_t:CDS:2 [Cetraspora pellucida]|uniref:22478_t:CDS:1 n=1 Tax=Cetraspora pellucida TaxID=1433469 RepID=A0A9N8ZAH6_9GLOM|nr:22478_t:CDS:2 [Cetraspora pellucida]